MVTWPRRVVKVRRLVTRKPRHRGRRVSGVKHELATYISIVIVAASLSCVAQRGVDRPRTRVDGDNSGGREGHGSASAQRNSAEVIQNPERKGDQRDKLDKGGCHHCEEPARQGRNHGGIRLCWM